MALKRTSVVVFRHQLAVTVVLALGASLGFFGVSPGGVLADAAPTGSVSDISVQLSPTTAVNASGVSYTVGFTASAGGAMGSQGSISISAAAGTLFNDPVTITDVTTGLSFVTGDYSGNTNAITIGLGGLGSSLINGGDQVTVMVPDVTNDATTGAQAVTVSTSSDQGATNNDAYTLTPEGTVSDVTVAPSLTAAGASGVSYKIGFTTSAGGAMGSQGSISISAPAGTLFNDPVTITDVTTGLSFVTGDYSGNTNAITIGLGGLGSSLINGGDQVTVTIPDVTSPASEGAQNLKVFTSSDRSASGAFTLSAPTQVAAPGMAVSTQAPGGTATYTATFTTSAAGPLAAGLGGIMLAGPPGTDFSPASYTVDDITSGGSAGVGGSVSNNGATVALTLPFAVAGGDQVSVTAAGVTNPTADGDDTLAISTTSDTVPATTPSYHIGPSAPVFTSATPPLVGVAGSSPGYRFAVTGFPAPLFTLVGAPSWLKIQGGTGRLSGTIPAGTKSFSYSVMAANSQGSATEGPYTVTVGSGVTVSGTVADDAGNPVADVIVNACDSSGGSCESVTTGDSGSFSLHALAGSTVVLTAYPPPGSGEAQASTGAIKVPARGITGETLTIEGGIPPISGGLEINGSTSPVVFWASPSTATITGCPNGSATVSIAGQNVSTGKFDASLIGLTETPVGSGFYTGVIPPQEPVHGAVEVQGSVSCEPQGPLFPDLGPASGGTTVLISGPDFSDVTGVSFGGVPAKGYTVVSQFGVQAVAPPGAGTVPVTVQEGSSGDVAGQYTYQAVTSISPSTGPAAGSTWVVIKGTGLGSATKVTFGNTVSPEFYQLSGTEIEALSPPGSGTAGIAVTTVPGGTTPGTAAARFTYTGKLAGRGWVAPRPGGNPAADRAAARALATLRKSLAAVAPGYLLPSVKSAAEKAAAEQVRRRLSPQSLIDVAGTIAKIIGEQGPEIYDQFGNLKTYLQSLASTLNANCENSKAALESALELAAAPAIAAFTAAITAFIESTALPFVVSALLIGGPLLAAALGVFYLLAPLLVAVAVDKLVSAAIEVDVDALLGPCPPEPPGQPEPPPPPFPPPPPLPPPPFFSPNTLIDPSGTVLNTSGHPVKGAVVTLLRSYTKNGAYLPVSTSSPGMLPAVNPETTKSDGVFHWDVSAAYYKVEASARGCTVPGSGKKTAVIGPYPVPPPRLGLTITLRCAGSGPPAVPAVTSLSQAAGPVTGGAVITVLGRDFSAASKVTFGGKTAKSVTYLSPQALSVTTPASRGLVFVRVETAGGTSATSSAGRYFFGAAPTIRAVAPAAGPASGGTKVTITGAGFTATTAVSFGGVPVKTFSVKSATKIVATTAKATADPVRIEVTNPAGSNSPTAAATFSYLAPVTAYIATPSGLTPVSVTTGKTGAAIKIAGAMGLASAPQGQAVYVAAGSGVTPISTSSSQAAGTVKTGTGPRAVAVTPNGSVAFVANYGSGTVTSVSTTTGLAHKPVKVGRNPDAVAITRNGATAYVADYGSGTITPITVATGKPGRPIKVGKKPDAIAITRNGATAYVADYGSGTITPIATATGKPGMAIKVGDGPDAIVVAPNGKTIYVLNGRSGTMIAINAVTRKTVHTIKVGADPVAAAITPDGKTIYIVTGTGVLVLVATAPGKTTSHLKIGRSANSITITP